MTGPATLLPLKRRCLACGRVSVDADLHSTAGVSRCLALVREDLAARAGMPHLDSAQTLADSLHLPAVEVTDEVIQHQPLWVEPYAWARTASGASIVASNGDFLTGPYVAAAGSTVAGRATLRLIAESTMLANVLNAVGVPSPHMFASHPGDLAVPHRNTVRDWYSGKRLGPTPVREAFARAVLMRARRELGTVEAVVLWRHFGLSEGLTAHGR